MASALSKYRAKHGESSEKRVSTVAVKHGDHVLLGKRRDNGKWTTPGGHLEAGENHHEGALRELYEESGIQLEPHEIHAAGPVRNVVKPDGEKLQVQGFIANVDKRPPTSMSDDPDAEVHRWNWVDTSKGLPKEIRENLHVPLKDNVLRDHLGHPDNGEQSMSLKKYLAQKKIVKGDMPHIMRGGGEAHEADIHDDEADELGPEGEGNHHDAIGLAAQLRERKADKHKIPKEHANLLGMVPDSEEDEYA